MNAHDDALIPEIAVAVAQARAGRDTTLAVDKEIGPGRIYQGVSKTVRALLAADRLDRDLDAGPISLARSLARTVDRMSGHNPTGWVANGRDLAPLVEQLRELLATLAGDVGTSDPLIDWLNSEDAPEEASADERS